LVFIIFRKTGFGLVSSLRLTKSKHNLSTLKRKENIMALTKTKILTILSVFVLVILITSLKGGQTEEIPRMTKEEAKELLDNPHAILLDLRAGSDWRASDMKIMGAIREDPRNLGEWIENYDRQRTYILYCA
jgi:hypothetical protein